MSTIHIINNDCNSQKTKHIDIRYNLVRELVKKNQITKPKKNDDYIK
jgi:hypothetical protein